MFTKTLLATALFASVVAPLAASAGEVENRIHHENARIDQGVRNGSVTAREYNHLDRSADRIQAERNRDLRRDDGHLTASQHRQLNRQENNLSDRIYFDKHNRARQRR
ncbi:MAG TPA: hypothetical protein VHT53_05180 [Candidatus Elarobacter sp.]|jgi:hypothetical protein|nr:hypothetical protein [Candidatus Elarobacter sp.]